MWRLSVVVKGSGVNAAVDTAVSEKHALPRWRKAHRRPGPSRRSVIPGFRPDMDEVVSFKWGN
jgi:hypothetical protein